MPKKTRKEKLLAQKRRLSSPSSPKITAEPSFQFKIASPKKNLILEAENSTELIAIKSDLFKTIILAFIAITIEIIVYWLLHNK